MKKLFTLAIFIAGCSYVLSQDQMIDNGDLPQAEFHVAINPLDSNNMVLATMQNNGEILNIYYTLDFGESWELSQYTGIPDDYILVWDPALVFDHSGNVLLANIIFNVTTPTLISKSEDGGKTWSEAYLLDLNSDKPWLAADRNIDSPYFGNIYMFLKAVSPYLVVLNDQCELIRSGYVGNGHVYPSIVVGRNGDVFTGSVRFYGDCHAVVQHSDNGGESFDHSTTVCSFPDYVANAPDVAPRFNPTPYLAIDNSTGPYSGRLYLGYVASEDENPDYFDVKITYSDDNGLTWSTPMAVNSNPNDNIQQFYSSIYVNDNGAVLMDWYDRSNYGSYSKHTDFFLGISYDGGETFTELQLNSESTDFEAVCNANNFGVGDYHQLVATNNTVLAFWSDGRTNDGDLNIYMAKVALDNPTTRVEELGVITDKISFSPLFPQPVTNDVNVRFSTKEETKLKYKIVDVREITVWESSWYTYHAGEHTQNIPCNFAGGSYHLVIHSGNGFVKSMKIIKH